MAGEDGITTPTGKFSLYTYAVLWEDKDSHDDLDAEIKVNPVYRQEYAVDLLREFPRLPLYRDFHYWAEMGETKIFLTSTGDNWHIGHLLRVRHRPAAGYVSAWSKAVTTAYKGRWSTRPEAGHHCKTLARQKERG